ncbi:(4Fe-4S)-binding protein [Methanocaldococcus indicus]|uniref:(4Fe-4S)-binding protein n=1 Tax=Methanocaldococcus indicus TaxID=213231 RepID=UPI003C6CEABD
MPKHILSGIKALVTFKLKKKGLKNKDIAKYLKIDNTVVSHYLSGTFPKNDILEVAEVIKSLPPSCGAKFIHTITKDKDLSKILVKELYDVDIIWDEEKCIFCYQCAECDAIKIENGKISIDKDKCCLCANCTFLCPTKALRFRRDINE